MTQIVHTIHRMMPKLVQQAVHNSMRGVGLSQRRNYTQIKWRRWNKKSKEEQQALYAEVVAINKKYGINPGQARKRHAPFKGQLRQSHNRKKVTLPTISF